MSEHTPGPWIYRPVPSDSIDGKTSFWIDLENGAPLADVRTRPDEEHAANARLISATPELLDALKALASSIDEAIAITDPKKPYNQRWQREASEALAAIRKAEGE